MKEQYQKEISQIHVPAKLLEKTKLAMQEEEKRLAAETKQTDNSINGEKSLSKKGKLVPFRRMSVVAAAAILLLLVVPATSGILKQSAKEEQQKQLYLAQKEEIELQTIEMEQSWLDEIVDKIKEIFD